MANFRTDINSNNHLEPGQNHVRCIRASSIIGDRIFNTTGESLGKINDIMIDINQGKVEKVIIELGGFLGLNQKYFAVPLQALSLAKEHSNAFILDETKESLNRYPEFYEQDSIE